MKSDKKVSNFSDRSLLRNLGHWLGLMTLARNKPILQLVSAYPLLFTTLKSIFVASMSVSFAHVLYNVLIYGLCAQDLDMKALLYEAYQKGSEDLMYVVPFIAKVLESSEKSKIFRPPNPWTVGILNVLSELHQQQDLKLNLKFEIEVLCKNLKIDIQVCVYGY